MKRKHIVVATVLSAVTISTGFVFAAKNGLSIKNFSVASSGNYWNHYAAVAPTTSMHGSKEFWANCSTHNYSLTQPGPGEDIREGVAFNTTAYFNELESTDPRYVAPLSNVYYTITFISNGGSFVSPIEELDGTSINEPSKPSKSGYKFTGWSYDPDGENQVSWPLTLNSNLVLYANWNEKVNIKGYFQTLLGVLNHNPYSFVPETMLPSNSDNYVEADSVNYDFSVFNNISEINYGGFGEQWHMVVENLKESERFYKVLSVGEVAINSSVVVFNNYLDSNVEDTASHKIYETDYTASINFDGTTLDYSIQYNTTLSIPFFGNVIPQVDMSYDVTTLEKTVRIQLSENNAMKYTVTDNTYTFGLEYGVETVSRKAYFTISKDDNDDIEGHIYEFVQLKNKDMVPSCADFYIGEDYTSVVGNKASGLVGFDGYINELYVTEYGKLLGYEVKETKTVVGLTAEFNTLWFNLSDISGLTNIKYVDSDHATEEMPEGMYVNNSSVKFESKTVGGFSTKRFSRRFDLEMRKRYFYSSNDDELVEHEVQTPMMFIQEEQVASFKNDVQSVNSYLSLSLIIFNDYLTKIEDDYDSLIDAFIENKDDINGDSITSYIGNANIID